MMRAIRLFMLQRRRAKLESKYYSTGDYEAERAISKLMDDIDREIMKLEGRHGEKVQPRRPR